MFSALTLFTAWITCVSSPGTVFLRNCCCSQGNPEERRPDASTSSPVKDGEEKPIQREPPKTLSQTGQRHRDEEGGSSARHGSRRIRQGLRIFRWELRVSELSRADGIRGHAERLRLEPRRQAKAKLQDCRHGLPGTVPDGCNEECAGQTGQQLIPAPVVDCPALLRSDLSTATAPVPSSTRAVSCQPVSHWREEIRLQELLAHSKFLYENSPPSRQKGPFPQPRRKRRKWDAEESLY